MAATIQSRNTKSIVAKKSISKTKAAKELTPNNSGSKTSAASKVKNTSSPKAKISPKAKLKVGHKKQKTIRDSFNMPAADYALIDILKKRALKGAHHVKKSELFRAGLKILAAMKAVDFKLALTAVETIKTGRPVKKTR